MTDTLFNDDAYLKSCPATVLQVSEHGVILDRSVFYAQGGGQPGDSGLLVGPDGKKLHIVNTIKNPDSDQYLHLTDVSTTIWLKPGDPVVAEIDWQRRHTHMRMHTSLHLLCSLIDAPVTGGSVSVEKSRLDFDLPEMNIDKLELTDKLNALIEKNFPVQIETISDEELQNNPQMVRTMSVKPPTGRGFVRLINIEGVDLQPCGGTHVRATGEIGRIRISKIEKKGRQNRRVNLVFDD